MKNGPRTFLEAPRPEPVNFFSPPEASRSAPGSIFIASWQPPGAQGVPRGSPEASGSSFWAILVAFLPPFWHRLWDICRAVLASVVGLREVKKQQFSEMCDPPARSRKKTAAAYLGNTKNEETANKSKSQHVQITQKTKSSPNKFSRSAWLRKGGRRCWRSHSQ